MRVVNEHFETITDYNVASGHLVAATAIREDAEPIDNIVKFAWADEDYEAVQMFVPNRRKESAPQVSETDAALAELGLLAAENAVRLDEQDAALCELAALIAGVCNMAAIYVRMIRAGRMTLEQVPERWRAQVAEMMEQEG